MIKITPLKQVALGEEKRGILNLGLPLIKNLGFGQPELYPCSRIKK